MAGCKIQESKKKARRSINTELMLEDSSRMLQNEMGKSLIEIVKMIVVAAI